MKKSLIFGVGFWISLLSFGNFKSALAEEYQIIAHPGVKQTEISKDKAKQMFLTNELLWNDHSEVKIIGFSPDAPDADGVAKEYMGMTGIQAKKFWLTKVFNNVIHSQPPLGDTADEVVEKVCNMPGAVGVVPKGTKLGNAKVLLQK